MYAHKFNNLDEMDQLLKDTTCQNSHRKKLHKDCSRKLQIYISHEHIYKHNQQNISKSRPNTHTYPDTKIILHNQVVLISGMQD